jgi:hypothetical protein
MYVENQASRGKGCVSHSLFAKMEFDSVTYFESETADVGKEVGEEVNDGE